MSSSTVSAVQAARNLSQGFTAGAHDVRKKSFSHTEFAKNAMKVRSREKRAAMEIDAEVTKSRDNNEALMEANDKKLDHAKKMYDLKKQGRQGVGAVAGVTRLAGALLIPEEKPLKPEKTDYSAFDKYYSERQKQLDADRTKPSPGIEAYDPNKNYGVPNTGTRMAGEVAAAGQTPADGTQPGTNNPNPTLSGGWKPLSAVIRYAEGTSGSEGYNTMFGGRKFTDMSRHPNSPMATGWGTQSEAAGAYQFMKPTWDRTKAALGLKDFSPESQEKAGRYLTQGRGVNPDQVFKTFDEFKAGMTKLAPEWASLPDQNKGGKSHYGQPSKSVEELWSIYQQNL